MSVRTYALVLFLCAQSACATAPQHIEATVLPEIEIDDSLELISPDGHWEVLLDSEVGGMTLQAAGGEASNLFVPGTIVGDITWSPDSRYLLVVVQGFDPAAEDTLTLRRSPGLWQVELQTPGDTSIKQLYASATAEDGLTSVDAVHLGEWSPAGHLLFFWHGSSSASLQADGLPLWVLDVDAERAKQIASLALPNPHYQSWAPDGQALVFTSGGYRSALIDKQLKLYDLAANEVTTLVSGDEQVPGAVSWSPVGDVIAYAAVPAEITAIDWADQMDWANPAILGRRIYLLDPASGDYWRLNDVGAYQDTPVWDEQGQILYYVQRTGDSITLMHMESGTDTAGSVPGCQVPLPSTVGYYGQPSWDDLLACIPGD
ncbi:MAG: hypothetical protein DWQ07_01490 [Chloroflexi bacterium]|nr:MAG: hypothetical protein DWQ07_01490 [Chloroflexota bacterium]MBL1193830.1 hypothetical protein [Chloroflexota bacterium]NOH11124.1 hypothetical protein [Chloroflexota bacterium]